MASQTQVLLDATEVTQSVQDLHHSVTLIAGKVTVVRLYVRCSDGPPVDARGTITLLRSPADPPVTLSSVNTVDLDAGDPAVLADRRADATLSLNFLLPAALTAPGALSVSTVSVTDALTGAALPLGGAPHGPTVWFHPGAPLRVRILGLRYSQGNPPVTYTPRDLDFTALVSWLRRAYPVAEVISSHTVIDAAASPPFLCDDVNAQLAAIRALDVSSGGDRRTHYLAQVPDGGFFMRGCAAGIPALPDPSTVAAAPAGADSWGWDFDGVYSDWYGAHELGHTYGRKHPGFCNQTTDDLQNYPFENGQLADTADTFVGFDVGDASLHLPMRARPGVLWHDVMTYCPRQWLSSYTYEGIRQRLLAEQTATDGTPPPLGVPQAAPTPVATPVAVAVHAVAGPGGGPPDGRNPQIAVMRVAAPQPAAPAGGAGGADPSAGQLVSIVGTVNLTRREGGIRFVNPVSPLAARSAAPGADGANGPNGGPNGGPGGGPGGGTPVVLRIRQANGAPPREIPVAVRLASELAPEDDRRGLIDAVVPIGPDTEAVDLVVAGQVVDTFRAAGPPPALRGARHASAVDGSLGLALEFDPGQDSAYTYSAQVSTDDGKTWQTIGVGLKDPLVQIDHSRFRPGERVRLRITTTNGFTSTTAETAPIQI
ncbi:hypothetical protein ACFVVX_11050 [Kitasatospora sp. NPDC058170]|uniref:hypothetical protein n=1 Tax=Kitasatospora sp. NPDC058170 TaxID=3346364 RepID=UPI0036DE3FCD